MRISIRRLSLQRCTSALIARKWPIDLAKATVILSAVLSSLLWFAGRYRVVYDAIKGENCLPYSVFLVDLRQRTAVRGAYMAFSTPHMAPFYDLRRGGVLVEGPLDNTAGTQPTRQTIVVKLAAGLPGDRVSVNATGVRINGRLLGSLPHLQPGEKLWRMGMRLADVMRDETIPAGHLWMMGTNPRSFDARYWGYIKDDQVIGRATPLW